MKIAPIQFNYSNRNVKFAGECGHDDIPATMDTLSVSTSGYYKYSKTHPIWVEFKFHPNGKISDIKIDYKNGKYASGTITESYDENGKNINYQV